jgi:hypothetical protein
LPVILSLENHLSHEQQAVMATIFKTILGDMLLLPDFTHDFDQVLMLKSPEDLEGKILLKGKRIVSDQTNLLTFEIYLLCFFVLFCFLFCFVLFVRFL